MGKLFTLLRAAALGLAAFACTATAQPLAQSPSSILVLNQDRLLTQTMFGQRIQVELEAASRALAAENRTIEADLTAEELQLTELRPTMEPEDFRVLAEEFDGRVVAIRAAQDAKARNIQAQAEAVQQRFFEETVPILLEIVQRRGAAVLLDSRSVLLSADTVDITETAIVDIDAALGNGGDQPLISLPGDLRDEP